MIEYLGSIQLGMSFADLHIHTTGSDGKMTPEQAVNLASVHPNLQTIAVTDHNTITSAKDAQNYARQIKSRIKVIVGTEINTKDGHLIALFVSEDIERSRPVDWTIRQIHEQGGLAIAAHPFMPPPTKESISLSKEAILLVVNSLDQEVYFDGFEVFNSGASYRRDSNGQAKEFFLKHNNKLGAPLGGTDAHFYTLGNALTVYRGGIRQAIEEKRTSVARLTDQERINLFLEARKMFGEVVDTHANRFIARELRRSVQHSS